MSVAEAEAQELQLEQQAGLWRDAIDRFRHNPAAMVGLVVLILLVLVALLAPLLTRFGPNEQVGPLTTNPSGPSGEFWFGLDGQGRDNFSRLIYGARLSLLVGLVSVAVGLTLGMLLGAVSGYLGGWVDNLLMRVMDIMLSIPSLLFAIGLIAVLGRGLFQIMLAVGIVNVPIFARLLRSGIIAQRESDYVTAARSLGAPGRRLLLVHILPNSLAPVIVQATLAMATAIIDVAGLSFLGLGPSNPGLPEWGRTLAENASRLETGAHLVFFPGFAIVISVLAINLIGDGLRESLDPKLRA